MGWVILAVIFFILLGIIGYAIGIYNHLIRVRHNVDKAWANIDVLLQQFTADQIPVVQENPHIAVCSGGRFNSSYRFILNRLYHIPRVYFQIGGQQPA